MVFSSSLFVFKFLPLVLLLYFAVRSNMRNALLLVVSLIFYFWGEKFLVAILLLSILANWGLGLWMASALPRGKGKTVVVWACVFNLGLLIVFKYSDWLWSILGWLLLSLHLSSQSLPSLGSYIDPASPWRVLLLTNEGHIRLPIGVSFFVFQGLSYVIDLYRREVVLQRNLIDFAFYKSFFPQLIAGPIVRYKDVAAQIKQRTIDVESFAWGIRRFVIGLGKKMLIANIVAKIADDVFAVPAAELTPAVAWLGVVSYTLQIYFDFSAYSDMAIGMGRMFGFRFLENFNYPYSAGSIADFWRRWHISLSTWFRDYLYIPLGGNRVRPARTYLNLVAVFFLCGLWHGASFNFVIWGLYHGVFLVLERLGLARWLDSKPGFVRHVYVVLVVMVGWVFFRAEGLGQAGNFLASMFGLHGGDPLRQHVDLYVNPLYWTAASAGIIGSTPWLPTAVEWARTLPERGMRGLWLSLELTSLVALSLVFFCSALELSANTYNPFIYFRF